MAENDKWKKLQEELGAWSDTTFPVRDPRACLKHLAEEVQETYDDPSDVVEWADCLLLLLDGARLAGFNTDDIYEAACRKLEINKNRKWGQPNAAGFVNHVRDENEAKTGS